MCFWLVCMLLLFVHSACVNDSSTGAAVFAELLWNHEGLLGSALALAHFGVLAAPLWQLPFWCSTANIWKEVLLWIARHQLAKHPQHCWVVWPCIVRNGSKSNLETMVWTLPHPSCAKLSPGYGVFPCRSSALGCHSGILIYYLLFIHCARIMLQVFCIDPRVIFTEGTRATTLTPSVQIKEKQ